jgi:hypothetical protein
VQAEPCDGAVGGGGGSTCGSGSGWCGCCSCGKFVGGFRQTGGRSLGLRRQKGGSGEEEEAGAGAWATGGLPPRRELSCPGHKSMASSGCESSGGTV